MKGGKGLTLLSLKHLNKGSPDYVTLHVEDSGFAQLLSSRILFLFFLPRK